MANKIKQFRFYGDSETDKTKNYPADTTSQDFSSGNVFQPYLPISQLGIQALPGTTFFLNEAAEPVIIGQTGIYELDLDKETEITNLKFSASSIAIIDSNINAYLIVDIIYDSREES